MIAEVTKDQLWIAVRAALGGKWIDGMFRRVAMAPVRPPPRFRVMLWGACGRTWLFLGSFRLGLDGVHAFGYVEKRKSAQAKYLWRILLSALLSLLSSYFFVSRHSSVLRFSSCQLVFPYRLLANSHYVSILPPLSFTFLLSISLDIRSADLFYQSSAS